ncbi:MAG: hypothetical protein WCX69_00555 [Candidatus Paceibacterota bacterium]
MHKPQTDRGTVINCGTDSSTHWFVKDLNNPADRIKHLEFHIAHGDYFAVLATIINIALKEKDFDREKIFKNLFDDLEYLQENYDIVKK